MAQFADDTQLFLANQESVKNVTAILRTIEANTGLKINYDKSSIYSIGTAKPFECESKFVWDPGKMEILGINVKNSTKSNYDILLQKAEIVCKNWYYRQLSLTGKVMIINTLVASIFVYTMQIECGPGKQCIKYFESLIHRFLWKGKKAKVNLELLKCAKANAGLKLVDLYAKNLSLKVAWLFKEDEYSLTILNLIMPKCMGRRFWDYTLSPRDIHKFLEMIDVHPFWKEICTLWFHLTWTKRKVTEHNDIQFQIIWYNSYIKTNNTILCYTECANKGLMFINCILNEMGEFKSFEQIQTDYGHDINWLEYESLKLAILSAWKTKLKDNVSDNIPENLFDKIADLKSKAQSVYNMYINSKTVQFEKCYEKIAKHSVLTAEQFREALQNIKVTTKITKYRDFQYRFLISAIFTNDRLYHWKSVESKKCEYCRTEVQTNKHLMFECTNIQLWHRFTRFLQKFTDIDTKQLEFKWENILINRVHKDRKHIVNYMVLITKQYVFAQKCLGSQIQFPDVISKIEQIYQYEKFNAKGNKQEITVHNRWCPYSGLEPRYNETGNNSNENTNVEQIVHEYINTHM